MRTTTIPKEFKNKRVLHNVLKLKDLAKARSF
jgi:hypothetical protein